MLKSALDRKVGADRLAAKHDPEDLAAKERNTLPCGESPPAVNEDQAGAGSGDREPHAVGHDLQSGSAAQDFERRGTLGITDERVSEPQSEAIERARNRNAKRLVADPAEILHRRVQTRVQHAQAGIHAATGALSTV